MNCIDFVFSLGRAGRGAGVVGGSTVRTSGCGAFGTGVPNIAAKAQALLAPQTATRNLPRNHLSRSMSATQSVESWARAPI